MPHPSDSREPAARRRLLRGTVAVTVLAGLAGYALTHQESGTRSPGPPHCTVADRDGQRPGDDRYTLQPQQAANAATIGAVGTTRELPERAVTIAIATAMQESSLYNIDHGDRDSLGLFQQRPSMGWGTEEEIMDPVYASEQFYDHLVEIPDYLDLPLTVAAQEVQRSAYPDEYAKHEPEASLLAAAITGREAAALNCTPGSEPTGDGEPAAVVERLLRDFGATVAPETTEDTVVVGIPDGAPEGRGWELAHWAMAHAVDLGISGISYQDQTWDVVSSGDGWQATGDDDAPAGGDPGEAAAVTELRLTVSGGE